MPIRHNRTKAGFTLVEMLVVLAIIGILAAILVPTLAIAVRTVNQGAIRTEMRQLESAIEQYKVKYQSYPLQHYGPGIKYSADMFVSQRNPWLREHVSGISRRADLSDEFLNRWRFELETPLEYQQTYRSPPQRFAATMGPTEVLVFALAEVSQSAKAPLGYYIDNEVSIDRLVLDKSPSREVLFEFKQNRLRDQDRDGWLEYYSKSDAIVPLVYFDSRVYSDPRYFRPQMLILDFDGGGALDVLPYMSTGVAGGGIAVPYQQADPVRRDAILKDPTDMSLVKWFNPNSYQLISAGVDESHELTPKLTAAAYPARFLPADVPTMTFDRDNLANFAELRLDALGTE